MDYFERMPWLLVPLIILTVEIWQLLKAFVRRALNRETTETAPE